MSNLNTLSDEARIWVYIFKSELNDSEAEIVKARFNEFVSSWQCHGAALSGAYELFDNKVLILAVEENQSVSGCSIDSSVRMLKSIKEEFAIDALDQTLIHFRELNNKLISVSRSEFATLCNNGDITSDKIVCDPLISTLGEFREGKLDKVFAQSWHAKAFQLAQ